MVRGGMATLLGWVLGGMLSDQLESYLPNYPLVKGGNVKFPIYGGLMGRSSMNGIFSIAHDSLAEGRPYDQENL